MQEHDGYVPALCMLDCLPGVQLFECTTAKQNATWRLMLLHVGAQH